MRFFVTFEVFETITGEADVKRAREAAGKHIQHIQNSGKLVEGGMLGDRRGGFFILDLDKPIELYDLLGDMFDMCRFESHPVLSFEDLAEFFRKEASGE